VKAGTPDDPVDRVTRAVQRDADQVQVGPGDGLHRVAVVHVVAGPEQLLSEHRDAQPAVEGPGVSRAYYIRRTLEDHHWLSEHWQVLGAVGVHIDLAEELWAGAGDRADEEGGRVQPLPGRQIITDQHRDLRIEASHAPILSRLEGGVLYVLNVEQRVRAWRPGVAGIAEVLHARFVDHAYPMHAHDTWTLLIVDDGAIRYDLDGHHHGAVAADVTLLPPHVPHDGRAATRTGFRKRVLYLDEAMLEGSLNGGPNLRDGALRQRIHLLHESLRYSGEELEAESRVALITQRLTAHLRPSLSEAAEGRSARLAVRLRELLDANVRSGLSLADASECLQAHPVHLVRSFTQTFGVAPHAYLTGRRIDHARRMLLCGQSPAEAATASGFYDQAHLTRHFRRYLGTTPARFAASA
jgi:AraC-like DNA-binding protein